MSLSKKLKKPVLTFPEDVAEFVVSVYDKADVILEYGSGGSTVVAAEMSGKEIVSVESDPRWLCSLNSYIQDAQLPSPPRTFWVDIGPTGKWGRPETEQNWKNYPDYALSIWDYLRAREIAPDVILIDGRFRAACFVASLLNIEKETTILFDDYSDRNYKQTVERFCKPSSFVGRMAVFHVSPQNVKPSLVLNSIKQFYNPG
ncbi:hypothetical protein [Aquibaculum arenosum]|uniref:DNA methylase N-4/N-6 domain-containing protein n=1 Tax=Aquibaculum arenosum TaxID=3032591 RepID=A0ABT5YMI7_9PROT|nr:hypothetical protein [Fodinicurvata sp. CAU 1616]MDF2096143.1 hypothetical protein [Fodinicurvata sp. CAU 1616]